MSDGVINVMLVDDHAVVRMGFRLLLDSAPDIKVVAEAASGEEACRVYPELLPDVVVMDISMPGMGGLRAIERIIGKYPSARILALSAHLDAIHPKRVMSAGAMGYLCKRSAPEELPLAVRQVAQGKKFIDPQIAQELALTQLGGKQDPLSALSTREFEVFIHLANGKSVAEIAEMLSLSTSTIGTHLYNIKQKLGVSNSAEIAMVAVRNGLIEV